MLTTLLNRRRAVTAAALTTALALVGSHPTLAHSVGVDVWNVRAWESQLHEATDRNSRLDAADEHVRRRIAVKEAAVAELLAGRASLAETTDLFIGLNAARPEYQEVIRSNYAGDSDFEKAARNVMSFALVRTPPGDRAAVTERLECELRALLATGRPL